MVVSKRSLGGGERLLAIVNVIGVDRTAGPLESSGRCPRQPSSSIPVATLAGTKQPNIARLESGKVVPRLDFLEKVARALGGHLDVRIVEGKSNA